MDRHTLTELIKWHFDIGVDELMADDPIDRTKVKPKKAAPTKAAPAVPKFQPPVASDNIGLPPQQSAQQDNPLGAAEAIEAAQKAAAQANDLKSLEQAVQQFEGCALSRTASHMVFGAGAEKPKLMIIGHTPGEEEDLSGQIFVGAGGLLLTKMLQAIGLERDDVYLSNLIYWRPPGNRSINDAEADMCLPFVQKQIALVQPQMIVTMGALPTQKLLGVTTSIGRSRGKWQEMQVQDQNLPVMPIFHPDYLLQNPLQKKQAWQDLQAIQKKLVE